ncbi:MAG: TIGR03617 family F420-dependent LLM class oxidoreductase [Acidimicrobiales bacterium]|nr:TIGR03617 family F420-dependent LLM class oxidoreductase [Acidimicrobiales bacterium]
MRIKAGLDNSDLAAVPRRIKAIEDSGFDGVSAAENAHDPFLPLAIAAVNSTRVTLETGVAIAFPRSPMMSAQAAWDLQAASNGRFVLGIGSQIKAHNERRYSTPWTAPAPRMREYINSIRAIWRTWQTGEKLDFQGEHYTFTLMTPNFSPAPLECAPPAIKISAVGPNMLALAGEACDGVSLHGFCTRDYIAEQIMPNLERGMMRTNRNRESFEVSGGGFVATGATDEDVAKAVEWVRYRVAFYGSTRAYWPVLAQHGLEDLGHKLLDMTKAGHWDQIAAEVSDDVVRLFAAVGRHDEIKAAIDARFGGLVDAVNPTTPPSPASTLPPDLIEDLKTIGSPFEGFATAV